MDTLLTDNVLAAVVGAILGAAIAHALDSARERRANARTAQRLVLGDIVALHGEWKALLEELYASSLTADASINVQLKAQLFRISGRSNQAGVVLAHAYSSRQVRASYKKLRSRYHETQALFEQTPRPNGHLRTAAFAWLDEQAERVGQVASTAAGIRQKDPGGIAWVGWGSIANKKWAEKYEALSFDDRAPPWRPEVTVYVVGLNGRDEEGQTFRQVQLDKIRDLVCAEHQRAIHVTFRGRKSHLSTEIAVCCEPMLGRARERLRM
ncbi:MAG: hypothetical protein HOP28_15835 [Gemmatimonadales bacterium]|nr:hypothetical protein [Gemmatimonadales bacterium]